MFDKAIKKIKDTTAKATYRAMNKALAKTNTQYKRQLSKATGLKSSDIQRRISQRKASTNRQQVSLSVGVRFGIPVDYFKAKPKVVRKKKRRYNGVSAVLPGQGRQVIPGAFFMTGKNGKTLVVKRSSARKFPVERIRVTIAEQAQQLRKANQKFLRDEFKTEYSRQVKLLLNK